MSVASHLNCNMPKYPRSLISQLRLGVLPLRIETEANRLCQVCAENKIENEYHSLFECSEYTEYRPELETAIDVKLARQSSQEMFVNVFNTV